MDTLAPVDDDWLMRKRGPHQDSSGNTYINVGNLRVTYVPGDQRTEANNWAGADVIGIQAYRGSDDDALHRRAEFPVESDGALIDLIGALCELYRRGAGPRAGG